MSKREIYWYEDTPMQQVIIGWRGGSEFRVDKRDLMAEVMRQRADDDPEKALKLAMKLSQYVDFEEVTEPIKLLN